MALAACGLRLRPHLGPSRSTVEIVCVTVLCLRNWLCFPHDLSQMLRIQRQLTISERRRDFRVGWIWIYGSEAEQIQIEAGENLTIRSH